MRFPPSLVSRLRSLARGVLCLLCLGLAACDEYANLTPADLAGTYVYQYRGGAVEELTLKADGTFHQAVFMSAEEFIAERNALHAHDGPWTHERNDINLTGFVYRDRVTGTLNLPPVMEELNGGAAGGWVPNWGKDRHTVLLRQNDQWDIMQMVRKRSDITQYTWQYRER